MVYRQLLGAAGANDAAAGALARFAGGGVDFKAKLIGVEDVAETRGDKMCQIAMAKLKAGVKAAREHKQRITVNVSLDGIKIIDDKSAVSVSHLMAHLHLGTNRPGDLGL